MNKYRAKPVTIDGIRFHSTAEGNRYLELRTLQKEGQIQQLRLQPPFPLHGYKGALIGRYLADFSYLWVNSDGSTTYVVEDVKGVQTALSKHKIRHAEADYNIKVRIIRMGRWKTGSGMIGNRQNSKASKTALMKA